jgi:hypothetical protein
VLGSASSVTHLDRCPTPVNVHRRAHRRSGSFSVPSLAQRRLRASRRPSEGLQMGM